MRILAFFLLAAVFVSCNTSSSTDNVLLKMASPVLIPSPQSIELRGDIAYLFPSKIGIYADTIMSNETERLMDILTSQGLESELVPIDVAQIKLLHGKTVLGEEGYALTCDSSGVMIISADPHGVFNGVMTLNQLFFDVNGSTAVRHLFIEDHPRFAHRGMLLDCCRHFMEASFVKRYIDLLARYKMNVLHWHLTEDQGWRVEIDAYPKLTEIGAWRTEADGSVHGGYYTKQEMREIVAYAAERHITVVPEIELPGHSSAAIASYPWLSCTGDQIAVENEWGVFKDIYCAGNDSTILFLETVLDEVLEIFPSELVHIGGDEAPKTRWEECEKCQHRIVEEGLHDEHELQSWIVGHFARFLRSRGRKLIGWDEILEGGLPEEAMVQSWRGMEGGRTAAELGRDVVMSPTSHAYFDYDVRSTDLEEVYHFDPIPTDLPPEFEKHIIGGECNMWTEHAPQEKIDSKVFPRILAMAEVLWRYPAERYYDQFRASVQREYPRLEALGVDYGPETVPLDFQRIETQGLHVVLDHKVDGLTVSWRNGEGWVQQDTITVAPGHHSIDIVTERNAKLYVDTIELVLSNHKALDAEVTIVNGYSPWYTGGGKGAMTDGFVGTMDFRDGRWQALQGEDAVYVLKLNHLSEVSEVLIPCYTYSNAWIFAPESIAVYVSTDGADWQFAGSMERPIAEDDTRQTIIDYRINFYPIAGNYLKIIAKNRGVCPKWHDAPGEPAWLFLSEIEVY